MTKEFADMLEKQCEELEILLSDNQKEQFFRYYEMLIEWNKVMNLTAITEISDVITKHFADSLLLVKAIPNIKELPYYCIDVGTGAGFPGIPLKIAFPQLKFVLLDSLNKRVGFLNAVINELRLENITAVHGRAEDLAHNAEYRESFDLCVSRAVANMSTLSEYCLPFVKTGGLFIPYKSGKIEEEKNTAVLAINKLGGNMESVISLLLPGSDVERTFIPVKKVKATQKKYPRKAGLPSKEPLK